VSTEQSRTLIEAELRRLTSRLRSAGPGELERAEPHVRPVLQRLADATQGVEQRAAAQPPQPRPVPRLATSALGDQLDVLGLDLLRASAGLGDATRVWDGDAHAELGVVLAETATTLQELRRML